MLRLLEGNPSGFGNLTGLWYPQAQASACAVHLQASACNKPKQHLEKRFFVHAIEVLYSCYWGSLLNLFGSSFMLYRFFVHAIEVLHSCYWGSLLNLFGLFGYFIGVSALAENIHFFGWSRSSDINRNSILVTSHLQLNILGNVLLFFAYFSFGFEGNLVVSLRDSHFFKRKAIADYFGGLVVYQDFCIRKGGVYH